MSGGFKLLIHRLSFTALFSLVVTFSTIATGAELNQVTIERSGDQDQIQVHVSEEVGLNVFSLSAPDRLVADFKPMSLAAGIRAFDARGGVIKRVRHGVQADGALRLVFDLSGSVTVDVRFEKVATGGIYRIVLMPMAESAPQPSAEQSPKVTQEVAPEVLQAVTPEVVEPTDATPQTSPEPSVSEPRASPDASPNDTLRGSTSDADRRAAAEAAAEALIKRQMEALDRSRSVGRQAWPTGDTPEAEEPGAGWSDPLAPPWD